MTQYIKQLPAVFQTVTEKKFFDATFDQVFSKKDSELLAGYIGRRPSGLFDPINDYYLPEPSKNRTWRQLEATVFARNEAAEKSNILFYDDLVEKIEYYGGNTLNHDRMFESQYYSFGPPINYDMFINYHKYFWVEEGLPTIEISGVVGSDIIGLTEYITPDTATPPNFKIMSGMTIALLDDATYATPHVVENIGGCVGIRLVQQFANFTAGTLFEFLPWDGQLELSTGRIIHNAVWDAKTWDTQPQPGTADYITIERGSLDRNSWSRTNKWFHSDVIHATAAYTNKPFPITATRGVRPIIEFIADLRLWNSGTQFLTELTYGFIDSVINDNYVPIQRADFEGRDINELNDSLDIGMVAGDLVCFFKDLSPAHWDMAEFDKIGTGWDTSALPAVNNIIYTVVINIDGTVSFVPTGPLVTDGDIVLATADAPYNGAQRGQTWYYENNIWQQAANDKVSINQPPLFQLYDHNGVRLDNLVTYEHSTFAGSKVFSYKINTESGASIDPVLRFPIVYTSIGQATDIVFQNDLMTTRYVYGPTKIPIDGYYYYKSSSDPIFYNNWNLHQPCPCSAQSSYNCVGNSKQRVIDKYVIGYDTELACKLSVTPYGFPISPDIIVLVNGEEVKREDSITNPRGYGFTTINNDIYVDLSAYLTPLLATSPAIAPTVEIQTYTHDLLDPDSRGFFQIPQQLEANPNQLEVFEVSSSDLIPHFSSIISNQINSTGIAFGGANNYKDSPKNRSMGSFILQNVAPMLKTMLVSSSPDLDLIPAMRFSQNEYSTFKNKYIKTALQVMTRGFSPVLYHNNAIVISAWVEEILNIINISKEFSKAFSYSHMIASGSPLAMETHIVPPSRTISLTNFIDLNDAVNTNYIYIYDVTTGEKLLLNDIDYTILSTNLLIEVEFKPSVVVGNTISVALYKNPPPSYIPSTPSKLGLYPVSIPRIERDNSYSTPVDVIVGHDGSRTVAYNDYRDNLILELEKRIYNSINSKYRTEYYVPERVEKIKTGYFRETQYSRDEYNIITEPYLNRWSARIKANYRINNWESAKQTTATSDLWKLYNYAKATNSLGDPLHLPGNWKGIFQYCYDTYRPDIAPWEMFGFKSQPVWWEEEYGAPVLNAAGQAVWTSTAAGLHNMWDDLEHGIIRQGPTAIYGYNYSTGHHEPQRQDTWARPGLSLIIPVDAAGEIISVMDLFDVVFSGNVEEPFDGFDNDWIYGDGGPVEQAWMSTSTYAFDVQEFLYLMLPSTYGELMWDTLGTDISAGTITMPGISGKVRLADNWQYVQNDLYTSNDPLFAWARPKNKDQVVHGELIDGVIQLRNGYQTWISDRILFLGKDVTSVFGQKIRTTDVNLANKLAGFTNKDTSMTYIESVSPSATTNTLSIPSTNYDVYLYKSPPVETYSYSGVIVRGLADGTFAVYGYDLLNSAFSVIERATTTLIDVSIGGTPAPFEYFTLGASYSPGDIVRYNSVYYLCIGAQLATQKFDSSGWQKLKGLPTVGGISVSYKPNSTGIISRIPYGTTFKTPQDVFDFLIGWGAYLESRGWLFDSVNEDSQQLNDWLTAGKQFLFWLNTEWAPDSSIQLSPLANKAELVVSRGYPDDVEMLSNGVYSILDKYGVAIAPKDTATFREGQKITVEPVSLAAGGIYYLQVNTSETEHILIYDNITSFNDVIYSPLLRARQERLRFNGFRSNKWYGKMEAPGYLILDNQLVPNYDTIVESMRYFYDPNITIDNSSLEDLGRHLIGFDSKDYFDNMRMTPDVQYLFYKGVIKQKGTEQAFTKLFRSESVQSNEIIKVYEEWALKLGDFGNTIEQVSTEIKLTPEQNTGEVIVARLNYVPSTVGFVKQINIINAEYVYTDVPKIVISAPDASPSDPALIGEIRNATAFAILDSSGKIIRIDITDPGNGYLSAPYVTIDAGPENNTLDKLHAVWQGTIIKDVAPDNVLNIDIDQPDVWKVRPIDPAHSLKFPTTDVIDYVAPNAGYVNINDVTWMSFNVQQTALNWGTNALNPTANDTVWIANTFTEEWNVFKLIDIVSESAPVVWTIEKDENNNLLLLLDTDTIIHPAFLNDSSLRTDFGNMIILQQINDAGSPILENNYTVAFVPYYGTDYSSPGTYTSLNSGIVHNAYSLVTLDNIPITTSEIGNYSDFTNLLLYKSMRLPTVPAIDMLPYYVTYDDLLWIDNIDNKWAVVKVGRESSHWDITGWDKDAHAYWDFSRPAYVSLFRVQEPLINSALFEGADVFAANSNREIVQIATYDPFKDIFPGAARQNITYMSLRDPARYNVTPNPTLLSNNVIFGPNQVGHLWWDFSSTAYLYYEQPLALDGSETEIDNLIYRRDNWGKLFPGSTVDIYEWVVSLVPPSEYTGSGTPRDINSYVQIITSNRFTSATEINYYFWVLNSTDSPNLQHRTMPAIHVSRMLQSPKGQGVTFFAPIQQTNTNNSYMFYNIQEILSYQGDNVQIQYRLSEREEQKHTQWSFFREGDSSCTVTDQYWEKMVDSLCGYTKLLPLSDEYSNSIGVTSASPWAWATETTPAAAGEILPVPDPMLGSAERYGINYRPRQSMFVNLSAARKILVLAGNEILKNIPIRDSTPDWNVGVLSQQFWTYINWVETGYETTNPTAVFQTLADAQTALLNNHLRLGDIVQVTEGTPDGRYIIYAVIQFNPAVPTLSFKKVEIENSAIRLSNSIYTTENTYALSTELRMLLNAFRSQVMINSFIVNQNELFFSLMNYVLSEQKNPDWVFKTSYIYIKESNLLMAQNKLYTPNQLDNIIEYITDVKPYHTQIRDYSSESVTNDVAAGAASDNYKISSIIQFSPDFTGYEANAHWDTLPNNSINPDDWLPHAWDSYSWDLSEVPGYIADAVQLTDNLNQIISDEDRYSVPLVNFDPSKKGYSQLYPYTFSFDEININNPQTFISPYDVISISVGDEVLLYGRHYYVKYNDNQTYTVYFYNNPAVTPVASICINGGQFQHFRYNTSRNEVAHGISKDALVVNVDTCLPVNDATGTLTPYVGWGDSWENLSGSTADEIISLGGTTEIPWDAPMNLVIVPEKVISFKACTTERIGPTFIRNSLAGSGILLNTVFAPTTLTEHIDVIQIYIDPLLHNGNSNILPEPGNIGQGVWIDGERIEYKEKTLIAPDTWELREIRRATHGTSSKTHTPTVPSLNDSLIMVPNPVWIEGNNIIHGSPNNRVWNTTSNNAVADLSTETITSPGKYTSVSNVPLGGLWYANTAEANFIRSSPGTSQP